eukprot:8134378-Ditylum_brightwellii.AAC.1
MKRAEIPIISKPMCNLQGVMTVEPASTDVSPVNSTVKTLIANSTEQDGAANNAEQDGGNNENFGDFDTSNEAAETASTGMMHVHFTAEKPATDNAEKEEKSQNDCNFGDF